MKLHWIGCVALTAALGCGDDDQLPVVQLDAAVVPAVDGAVASTDMSSSVAAQNVAVTVGPGGAIAYAPAMVAIHTGDTVTWTWEGGPHTVTSGVPLTADGQFCSLPPGSDQNATTCAGAGYARFPPFTFAHVFNVAGTFHYFCEVHGALMTGTVVVTAR